MKILKFLLVLVLIAAGVLYYAFEVEPDRLVIEEIELESDVVKSGTKVAIITDIHIKESFTEEKLTQVVDKVNGQQPDAVLFMGDLYDNYKTYEGDKDAIIGAFSKLDAPVKLAVYGNHDYGGSAQWAYKEIMEKSGFTILKNAEYATELGITFYGADDYIFGDRGDGYTLNNNSYNFAFAHAPMSEKLVAGYDFFAAGHSHGGQVKLPFIDPVWLPTGTGEKYSGLYENEDGTIIYISRGIGTSLLDVRLGSVPEITICKFSKKTVEK